MLRTWQSNYSHVGLTFFFPITDRKDNTYFINFASYACHYIGSSVTIVIRLWKEQIGIRFSAGTRDPSFHQIFRPTCSVGTRGSFPDIKRSGLDAYWPFASSSEVKNGWSYKYSLAVGLRGLEEDKSNFRFAIQPLFTAVKAIGKYRSRVVRCYLHPHFLYFCNCLNSLFLATIQCNIFIEGREYFTLNYGVIFTSIRSFCTYLLDVSVRPKCTACHDARSMELCLFGGLLINRLIKISQIVYCLLACSTMWSGRFVPAYQTDSYPVYCLRRKQMQRFR